MWKYKFGTLRQTSLLHFGRLNNWFMSVDLKNTYFHIPIWIASLRLDLWHYGAWGIVVTLDGRTALACPVFLDSGGIHGHCLVQKSG